MCDICQSAMVAEISITMSMHEQIRMNPRRDLFINKYFTTINCKYFSLNSSMHNHLHRKIIWRDRNKVSIHPYRGRSGSGTFWPGLSEGKRSGVLSPASVAPSGLSLSPKPKAPPSVDSTQLVDSCMAPPPRIPQPTYFIHPSIHSPPSPRDGIVGHVDSATCMLLGPTPVSTGPKRAGNIVSGTW